MLLPAPEALMLLPAPPLLLLPAPPADDALLGRCPAQRRLAVPIKRAMQYTPYRSVALVEVSSATQYVRAFIRAAVEKGRVIGRLVRGLPRGVRARR